MPWAVPKRRGRSGEPVSNPDLILCRSSRAQSAPGVGVSERSSWVQGGTKQTSEEHRRGERGKRPPRHPRYRGWDPLSPATPSRLQSEVFDNCGFISPINLQIN